MKQKLSHCALAKLTLTGALIGASIGTLGITMPAAAQVAGGTTTMGISVIETTQLAMGWSVKKTLLGKTVYNDLGNKVGKVDDLIISPDKSVSYVILGAGGFVGIGRHDVAVPISQIQDKGGKLVMAGATKETIKALPEFSYATNTSGRDAFIATADQDIAKGKAAIASLDKKADAAAADAKARINADIAALQVDIKAAEAKLSALKQAGTARWREFETDVISATARLRKSIEKAVG